MAQVSDRKTTGNDMLKLDSRVTIHLHHHADTTIMICIQKEIRNFVLSIQVNHEKLRLIMNGSICLVCTNEEIYCVGEQVMEDNCVCNCEQEPPPKCALDLASKLNCYYDYQ